MDPPSKVPRGGIKRSSSSVVATPSKLPRGSTANPQRRYRSLGPRRAIQADSKVSQSFIPSSQQTSQSTEQNEIAARPVSAMNRPSFVATASDRPPNSRLHSDPRPIRDPEFQKTAMRTIIRYLADAGYGPVTVQAIRGLSYRTFQQIFKFLHIHVAPNYVYPDKFEDVFTDILKRSLKYPLAETLSPRALFSIAAPHSYPSFLALLLWMVDACKFFDHAKQRYAKSTLEEEEEDRSEDTNVLFFDYSWTTYCAFLNGANNFDEYDNKLTQLFDEGERKYREDLARQVETNRARQGKLDRLKSQPNVKEELLRHRKEMEEDMTKFEEYTEEKKKRIAKYTESTLKTEHEARALEAQCAQVEQEHAKIQDRLKSMDISIEEMDQLVQEQMDLETAIVDAQALLQKLTKEKTNAEALYAKKLSRVEEVKKNYHTLLAELDLLAADNVTDLELAPSTSSAEEVKSVKRVLTPRLEDLKRQYEAAFNNTSEHISKSHQKLMSVQNRVAEQRRKISVLKEKYEETKEAHEAAKQRFLREVEKSNENMAAKDREMKNQKRAAKNELYNQQKAEKSMRDLIVEFKAKAAVRHQETLQEGAHQLAQLNAVKSHIEKISSATAYQLEQ